MASKDKKELFSLKSAKQIKKEQIKHVDEESRWKKRLSEVNIDHLKLSYPTYWKGLKKLRKPQLFNRMTKMSSLVGIGFDSTYSMTMYMNILLMEYSKVNPVEVKVQTPILRSAAAPSMISSTTSSPSLVPSIDMGTDGASSSSFRFDSSHSSPSRPERPSPILHKREPSDSNTQASEWIRNNKRIKSPIKAFSIDADPVCNNDISNDDFSAAECLLSLSKDEEEEE